MNLSFKEDDVSQQPALLTLKKMGYTYLTPDEALDMRGGKTTNVLLEDVLRKQLKKINTIKIGSVKTDLFTEANIENGLQALKDLPVQDGYMVACQAAYERITLGKTLDQNIDGDKKSFTMQYIDWKHPENNVYHVTEEYAVMRSGSKEHYRPDIVLFVNGIPLCVIECKRPDMKEPISQAISQHIRNQQEDGIRSLYVYSQLLLSLSLLQARYATTDTKEEFWAIWKEEGTPENNTPEQEKYLKNLCKPERLLELTKDFIIFEGGKFKKIARYQQYFVIKKIMERIQNIDGGRRKGGVIWHTQGSGKSLTMALLAQKIYEKIPNARIVLVTDRVDLDTQITDTFRRVDIPVMNAKAGNQLVRLLKSNKNAVVTTVINKFEAAVNQIGGNTLNSSDIFVLIDEGHRTQYGTFNVKMQKVLPNACFLAFTGTPLMKKEKSTAQKFGGIIDSYTIVEAVEDKAIVPIIYEGRYAVQNVNQNALDRGFDHVSAPLTDYQKADLKRKYSRANLLEKTEQRIDETARDISDHFTSNWGKDKTGESSGFKGMLVAPDKATAVKYKKAFDLVGKLTTEVIISAPDDRDSNEDVYEEPTNEVIAFWKKMEDKYGKDFERNLINQFKKTDYPDLLIVVNKLLTGFDEPRVVVMYVCKKLAGHNLLQAIARVNRVAPGKDFGFVIDYEGIIGELDEAMDLYSNLDEFDTSELVGTLIDIQSELEKLPQLHSNLNDIFKTLSKKFDLVSYTNYLTDEAIRSDFYQKFYAYARCLKIAFSSIEFENNTTESIKTLYKTHLRFYAALRNSAMNVFSDNIEFKQYERQLQKLIDQHVTTEEIIRITEQVSILDADAFQRELEKVGGLRAKAETIASRTSKHITEHLDEDPVFYKRLSELIQQTIYDLRASRISEAAALKKLKEYSEQSITKKSDDVPGELQHKEDAIPFYRILSSETSLDKEICADFASVSDRIINDLKVVNWTYNKDIINKINFNIGEYLIDELKMSIDLAEKIADECVEVAKIRYKS